MPATSVASEGFVFGGALEGHGCDGSHFAHRHEHDSLGSVHVPADVYYGIHTQRALDNFPITGQSVGNWSSFVKALAAVKEAAAQANLELGLLAPDIANAIISACREVRAGALHDQLVVDVIQGGAGTSTNMNMNEVLANRALELLDRARGEYDVVHPLDHVNLSQSTNDVYPTAARIAIVWELRHLSAAVDELADAFAAKGTEFSDVLKIGRTQLQEAVPMTLGQEMQGIATTLLEEHKRLRESESLLLEVHLGGTAIGTGINAPRGYAELACASLATITSLEIVSSPDRIEATSDVGAFVHASSTLKRVAIKLSKVANDLRLLSSGPRAGLAEIRLPAVQAGSSIMPGKVNPVIPEVVNQIAFQVVGHDVTVSMAAGAGQLQLNAFEPVVVNCLMSSIHQLIAGCTVMARRCVSGIQAEREQMLSSLHHSAGLATALTPLIGYSAAAIVAKEVQRSGLSVRDVTLSLGLLTPEVLDGALHPRRLTGDSSVGSV